jgi:hypothetical protein
MQRETLERIQRENEQKGGATEFQKLAQRMLRSNHLTESTAQPTAIEYNQLTTMQRLIKEDELQKEIFRKEQEERALTLQRQREKQQQSQPKSMKYFNIN